MKERQIETMILDYLAALPGCDARKNESVGVFDPTKRTFRKSHSKYRINGVSDILGYYKNKSFAIEVKTESEYKFVMKHYDRIKNGGLNTKRDRRLFDQISFIEMVKNHDQIGFFACSVDQVKENLVV